MSDNRVCISQGDAQSMADELREMRQRPKDTASVRATQGVGVLRHTIRTGYYAEPINERTTPRGNGVVVNQPDPNVVMVNGIETSRKVAENMGWIDPQAPVMPGQSVSPFGESAEPQEQGEPQPETPGVEDVGNRALDELSQVFEGDTYATAMEAAESGDYDALAKAHGLDAAKVALVVAGATARADRTIAELGVDTGIMSEVLDARDLADARRAVVQGDDARLRDLADKTVTSLASWPSRDPQAFRAWFARTVDAKFDIQGTRFVVETAQGWMPWESVVRLGGLKRNN